MPATKIEKISYGGWPNCYRVTDGEIELVATADVGPRVISCGFAGERNLFYEKQEHLGKSGESWYMSRGGHRLWVAPEVVPDTYESDNTPVRVTVNGDRITLLQATQPETQLLKEISVELSNGAFTVTHRIENAGPKPRQLAPWAITKMVPGGFAIVPFPPRVTHEERLLPTHPLVMWGYTDFSDSRWRFTTKYLILECEPVGAGPQKAGLFNPNTVVTYLQGTDLFVIRAHANSEATYPDFQSSCQIYACDQFLELETLGPLVDLIPGSSVAHVEHWSLHRNIKITSFSDDEIDQAIAPLLA